MKSYYLLMFSAFFYGCTSNLSVHNYSETKYDKLMTGYVYSNEVLKFHENTFMPIIGFEYMNDTIKSITLYRSEGQIEMSKIEFESDVELKKMFDLPIKQFLKLENNFIEVNGKVFSILERQNNKIFCMSRDTLFIYNIHK